MNAVAPPRVMISALRAALLAASVPVWPMSRKEHKVVTSQNRNSHSRSLESTAAFMPPRNSRVAAKNWGWRGSSRMYLRA